MKNIYLILFLALTFSACSSSKNSKNNTSSNTKTTSYTGDFKSIKGVMNDLSCYCYNSGFLTTDDGAEISICFNDNNITIDCERITVEGYFENIIIEDNPNSPCSGGEKETFIVTNFNCE